MTTPDNIDAGKGRNLPDVLLPYQQATFAALDALKPGTKQLANRLVVYEKSRRIGLTWGLAAWCTLKSARARGAGGSDVLYIGYALEMTREFIDECGSWARVFGVAANAMQEFLFEDADGDGDSKHIKAFRISFASGYEIIALSSRPRSLRGKQGVTFLDEAAFHEDVPELLKAAMALTMWGGQVVVVSTHDGADNAFNELITQIRAGDRKGIVLRTTLRDAIEQGLVKRIFLKLGVAWSPEAEAEWEADLRASYADAAAEELDCIPRQSGGRYLARTMLESRATDAPVVRLSLPDSFVDEPEEDRIRKTDEWFTAHVLPLIKALPPGVHSHLGVDFGRDGDLSVNWPLVTDATMHRSTPFLIELRNVPFTTQQQITFALIDALPGFGGAAFDARGNGQFLAEVSRQRYGVERIAEVMITEGWYREHMPPMRGALEDAALDIPRDKDVIGDLHQLSVVNGVARVEGHTTGTDGKKRHGDAAIGCCLALFASRTLDGDTGDVGGGPSNAVSPGAFGDLVAGSRDVRTWFQ